MTAAGIFNGGDGNNFNPDATLTREQAAKIITSCWWARRRPTN